MKQIVVALLGGVISAAGGLRLAQAGETIELAAKPTVTPVELNLGDTVKFKLLDGRTRTIRAVDTSARIIETPVAEGHVVMFDVTLEVDGHKVKVDRYTGTQQAFYEPLVVNGVRIWTDMALSVFNTIPMRYPGEGNLRQRPWKDVRLALQDATIEDCPVKLSKWFDYVHPSIYIGDCYHGSDCWMGSFGEGATHGGLDVNQRKGDPLYAPLDFDGGGYFNSLAMGDNNNRWRGWRKWPDGSIWAFQVHHVITQRVERGENIRQGMHLFDGAGVWVGGFNHNHYELKIANGRMPDWSAGSLSNEDGPGRRALETGQPEVYHLDPWIYFRQIFRNEREKTGYVYPEMSPVGPAKTGEAVKFSLTKGGSSDVYWDFGDGAFSHGAAVLHRYAKSGIYAARAVVVRHDGTMDEVVRHLTVDGPPTAAPSPVVESDDCGFDHWKAGVQYPFGFHAVDCRPGVIVFEAAGASHGAGSESRTLRIGNAGAGRLPPLAASLPSACGWLCLKTAMDELTLTIDPSKAAFGTNETVVVLRCDGSLNGDIEIPVCLHKSRSGAIGGDFVMDIGSRGFYATPGFWCSQRLRGSKRRYLSSGSRPEADAVARFSPGPMEEGTYRVRVCADTPWTLGSSCEVNVKGAEGVRRVRFDPAKSWTVGDFRFASGSGNYVEFLAKDCVGSVVVNSLSFERLAGDVSDSAPPRAPETLALKACPTATPVEMNVGDTVLFTLFNGETRSLRLVDTSASVAASTAIETVYAFSMTLEIDGEIVTLERSTAGLDAYYEPFVVNGVRIWPDSALKLFDVATARSSSEGSRRKRLRKDACLALQDATSEDRPETLLQWFKVDGCVSEGCRLDPWICFRQISRNERERVGCEYPEMAPVGPAKVLECVDFKLTAGADAVEVYWDFGDGTFARGTKASHRYGKRGVYAARAVVARRNGTKDELVRHLTVSGTDAASPSLCVTADEPSFFPRPVGSPQSLVPMGEIFTPGVMTFKIDEVRPHVETRELVFENIGGGELPDLSVRLASPCDWLTFARTARGVRLTVYGAKAHKGVSEAVLVVSGNGLLNGSVEVPVKVETGECPWTDNNCRRNFYAYDTSFPSTFYATPGGWYPLVGYNFGRFSTICTSGARRRAGEEARFIPWIPKPGKYEVTVPLDTPMGPGHSCNVRIRGAHGVESLRFEPGKSMSLGVHEFSAGTGNYISFESAGSSGEVVVRKIRMTMTDKTKTDK